MAKVEKKKKPVQGPQQLPQIAKGFKQPTTPEQKANFQKDQTSINPAARRNARLALGIDPSRPADSGTQPTPRETARPEEPGLLGVNQDLLNQDLIRPTQEIQQGEPVSAGKAVAFGAGLSLALGTGTLALGLIPAAAATATAAPIVTKAAQGVASSLEELASRGVGSVELALVKQRAAQKSVEFFLNKLRHGAAVFIEGEGLSIMGAREAAKGHIFKPIVKAGQQVMNTKTARLIWSQAISKVKYLMPTNKQIALGALGLFTSTVTTGAWSAWGRYEATTGLNMALRLAGENTNPEHAAEIKAIFEVWRTTGLKELAIKLTPFLNVVKASLRGEEAAAQLERAETERQEQIDLGILSAEDQLMADYFAEIEAEKRSFFAEKEGEPIASSQLSRLQTRKARSEELRGE